MVRPVMFLRTAQTEQRITDLEEKMAMVLTKLGMVPASPTDEEWEAADPVQVAKSVKVEAQATLKPETEQGVQISRPGTVKTKRRA